MDQKQKDQHSSSSSSMSTKDGERETWTGKLDFVMSALSFAVGMGNLWRFPYLCYRNGGGAFLLPYLIMMLFCGYPLMFLELALGQYARQGIINVWRVCPIFKGIGCGMLCVSVFTCIYYNMTIAWCFFYLFASFTKALPWSSCDNSWNTAACTTSTSDLQLMVNCSVRADNASCSQLSINHTSEHILLSQDSLVNTTTMNLNKTTASEEFFQNYMLGLSPGLGDFGSIQWQLAMCLLLCWILIFGCLAKGIQVSGKITYITATFPYIILSILLVRGVTLDGAVDGIAYYLTPDWEKLLSAKVWADAAMQAFFSLSLCWGGMITLSSYNNFNNDCLRDTIVVATGDMLTSIFSGFVLFSIIGYMAHILEVPVSAVAAQGPGLAFVVYPEVVTQLPVSQLWSSLFMIMLINVGMGTQMGTVSTIQTTVVDMFPRLRRGKRPFLVLLLICVIAYTIGLSLTTNGGAYLLLLLDSYSATYALLVLALCECIAIGWVYGVGQFMRDIETMIGRRPSVIWLLCWRFVTPLVVIFLIVSVILDFNRSSYGDYIFPIHWELVGASITLLSVACIPGAAILQICTSKSKLPFFAKVKELCKPSPEWEAIKETEYVAASKLLVMDDLVVDADCELNEQDLCCDPLE